MAEKDGTEDMVVDDADIEIDEVPEGADMPKLFRENISTLVRAVELDDKNLIRRVWRRNTPIRRDLSLYDFQDVLAETFPKGERLKALLGYVDQAIKDAEKRPATKHPKGNQPQKASKAPKEEPLMEVEAYLVLFIVSSLIKQKQFEDALNVCREMLDRFQTIKRQTLDSFVAKTFSYYSLASEKLHHLGTKGELGSHYDLTLMEDLLIGQKMSSLRLYEQSQATVINLILRKYLNERLYSQARMFLNSTHEVAILDSSNVGHNEQIRYLYYSGKVAAVEANYSDSDSAVSKAMRKCPANTGLGFRLAITKLNIVTKLLMGEVPERSIFYESGMINELRAYFHLVKSVRNGSVAEYDKISATYKEIFERDDLMTLVERLRASVIRTGLRNINLAYSRITFKDIMAKLELKSEKDAELVCAKAIRDAIIENAIVDPASKSLISTETVDVYSTTLEPKAQFSGRIDFCLGVHNAALKAHKYPPNSHKAKTDGEKKPEDDELNEEELLEAMDDLLD